jgi:adenylate cyclase
MFDTIRRRAEASGHIDAQVAVVAAEMGFVDETYDLLGRMRLGPAGHPRDVMGTHAYRTLLLFPKAYPALRADPRFITLCARLGLADYWLKTGHWPDFASDVDYDVASACEAQGGVTRENFVF